MSRVCPLRCLDTLTSMHQPPPPRVPQGIGQGAGDRGPRSHPPRSMGGDRVNASIIGVTVKRGEKGLLYDILDPRRASAGMREGCTRVSCGRA